ncbi:hypothetical protein DJ90_5100 [Paenibacillus macerans]|uniref:Uncharacterized protein n=2 Tax=Paenibacillus macerans TaxID=44252 RepID=A0A090ZEK6_PAEMA|nr:hypothetical protein DJ90_5100 [Paenibacillus macerans]
MYQDCKLSCLKVNATLVPLGWEIAGNWADNVAGVR